MRTRIPIGLAILCVVVFIYAGFRGPAPLPEANWDPIAFLLTVAGLVAAISGVGFAVYGYFNTHHAEKIIAEKLDEVLEEKFEALEKENLKMQEAMQKVMTAYKLQFSDDPIYIDRAIDLFHEAVSVYPKVYNGYTSLAYAYWSKGDMLHAKEYFHKAIELFPESVACINDMARFSAKINEHTDTYMYLKKLLDMNPKEYQNIEGDPVFNNFKDHHKVRFEDLINRARESVSIQNQ